MRDDDGRLRTQKRWAMGDGKIKKKAFLRRCFSLGAVASKQLGRFWGWLTMMELA